MNKKEAYFILISIFVLILAWIIFSILQSAVNSTISEPLVVQISPINPTFDTQIITTLKKRTLVKPATEIQTTIATDAAQLLNAITPTPTTLTVQATGTTSAIPILPTP